MAKNSRTKKLALNIVANIKRNKAYIQELWYALNLALIIFVIMEIIKPRIVLAYLNLNLILLVWLLVAIILLFLEGKDSQEKK